MCKVMDEQQLVGRKLKRMAKQIVLESHQRGVNFKKISNKKFIMSYGKNSYSIRRGSILSSINPTLSKKVCDSKEMTSRILRSRGFNAPENAVFSKVDLERAWQWAKHILPVVLKPFDGKMGRLVFVNINNYQDFRECYKKIVDSHDEVLVEEFIEGEEFRFTYIDNDIVAVAKRVPANVIGTGHDTVEQLIHQKNTEKKENPIHKSIKLDQETNRVLARQSYTLQDIPSKNETVFLRDNSNVSTGGDAIDVTNEISDDIKNYVRRAVRTINGLVICGADVLIKDDEVTILELNPRPMIAMHVYPWKGEKHDVVGKLVDALFPETVEEINDIKEHPTKDSSLVEKEDKRTFKKLLNVFRK